MSTFIHHLNELVYVDGLQGALVDEVLAESVSPCAPAVGVLAVWVHVSDASATRAEQSCPVHFPAATCTVLNAVTFLSSSIASLFCGHDLGG